MMLNSKLLKVSSKTVILEHSLGAFATHLPFDSAIFISIYPRESKSSPHKGFQVNVIVAESIIAKIGGKQNICPSIHKWINIVVYHLAIKRNKLLLYANYDLIS